MESKMGAQKQGDEGRTIDDRAGERERGGGDEDV